MGLVLVPYLHCKIERGGKIYRSLIQPLSCLVLDLPAYGYPLTSLYLYVTLYVRDGCCLDLGSEYILY